MDVQYHKDELGYYQRVTEIIHADYDHVYSYLATNKISEWFPELSFKQVDATEKLVFDMGEGEPELYYTIMVNRLNQEIKFQWDDGVVHIKLDPTENGTVLTLEEQMPLNQELDQIANDFVGWYFQVLNIRTISETGDPEPLEMLDFIALEAEILDSLEKL